MKVQEVYKNLLRNEPFSITILLKNGEIRYYNRAIDCGQKWSLKRHRMRALQPISQHGKKIGHPVPFSVFKILKFNGENVEL